MKKIASAFLFLAILSAVACSDDSSSSAQKQSAFKQNDVDTIEKVLENGETLGFADPFVTYILVEDYENARQVYKCVIADTCSFNEETNEYQIRIDSTRFTQADDGAMSFKVTDEYGSVQGTFDFEVNEDSAIPSVGYMGFKDVRFKTKVFGMFFVTPNAWPENGTKINPNDVCRILRICN